MQWGVSGFEDESGAETCTSGRINEKPDVPTSTAFLVNCISRSWAADLHWNAH